MNLQNRSLWAAALALPILGYLTAIGWAQLRQANAPEFELAITGYDPRDLVRGHYVEYRLNARRTPLLVDPTSSFIDPTSSAGVQGACLERAAGDNVILWLHGGDRPSACFIDFPTDFALESHRFYVTQDHAERVTISVREGRGSIRVALLPNDVVVRQLSLDGRAWNETAAPSP